MIDLFADDELAGFVTEETRIKCERSDDDSATSSRSHGEEEPSDNSGPGSVESGHHGHHGDRDAAACGTDALQVGAVVEEAELHVRNGNAVFEEVELAH